MKHCNIQLQSALITLLISISLEALAQQSQDSANASFRQWRYTSRAASETYQWQNQLRSALFGILKLDDLVQQRASIPLSASLTVVEERESYHYQELQIHSTPTRTIPIVVTIPKTGQSPYPAVVCIHGHGGTRYSVYDRQSIYKGFASELAERGYITIAADVGQHEVFEEGRILMGERLWDVMRCVDYLATLPEINMERIGCAGLSLGGEMTMWLGAMEPRVTATISSGFLTYMDHMEQNHCMCWKFDGLRELVDYPDIYSLIAPRALQCQNGLQEKQVDFYVPIAQEALKEIQICYKELDALDRVELDVHPGAHEIDLPALLSFFERCLKD